MFSGHQVHVVMWHARFRITGFISYLKKTEKGVCKKSNKMIRLKRITKCMCIIKEVRLWVKKSSF